MHGRWTITPTQYIGDVTRFRDEVGMMDWAAPQDWMCEPAMLEKTGFTVQEHQRRTIENYLELRESGLPFIPVLQGWTVGDYLSHASQYIDAGVDLFNMAVVGVGTVCRRQHMAEGMEIMSTLAGLGLNLHGFGFKTTGLMKVAGSMVSADSMAWSFDARRAAPLEGCLSHINCANCIKYALKWRDSLLARLVS
jgi:hypothetical protein